MEIVTEIISCATQLCVDVLDAICIIFIVLGGILSVVRLIRHKQHIALTLTRYMNIALLFKLCAEIVRLVLVRTFAEMGIVAGIVALHGVISFLIDWEVRREEGHDKNRGVKNPSTGEDVFL